VTRREWIAAGATGLVAASRARAETSDLGSRICVFTDHLAGFPYEDVARMLRDLKVAGPDLTVRPGGLVKPERVSEDLPRASAVFKEYGLSIPMITTAVRSAEDPLSRSVLSAASKAGIEYYRPGYYPYKDLSRWAATIANMRKDLTGLAELNRQLNLRAALHNHSGESVGCAVWDLLQAMDGVDPKHVGLEFDPTHATIEGGKVAWNLNFRRATPRIFILGIKDYVWEKTPTGWRTRWVPLGEGMMQWDAVFNLIHSITFPGPISLHMEYVSTEGSLRERYDRSMEATARDVKFLRDRLRARTAQQGVQNNGEPA
jgi:sugar phosphate isomerase/epimerase